MDSELRRKCVHISMVGFALLIGRLSPLLISALCGVAFLFNLLVLPRVTARDLERKVDLERGFSMGMLAYPAILLLLSLIFFRQQAYMAVAWGAMAFGDGFAGLVGARLGGPKLPWNPDKSISGTVAFVVLGTPLTIGLLWLLPPAIRLELTAAVWFPAIFCGMAAAALMESVEGLVDDNLVVPTTAAVVTLMATHLTAWPPLPHNWSTGLALVALLVVFSIGSRKIDVPGGFTGGLLALFIFLGGGLWSLLLLFLFFVLGSAVSHWKIKEKERLGLAQENKGKRSVRHALSNGGAAAFCGLLAWLFPEQAPLWQVGLAASLASAAADTTSSELGSVYGTRFVNVLTFKEEPRGLDGVVSMQGTVLGFFGGVLIALAHGLSGAPFQTVVIVALAGTVGNLADSVMGATLQRRGYMSNHTVNFANTAVAAFVAAVFCGFQPYIF